MMRSSMSKIFFVDSEKIATLENPRPMLRVVLDASREIRSSVVYGTAIVVLVFIPLFALEGMEGRVFVPLATAYVVSLLVSLFVSLTVTPALSSLLLSKSRAWYFAVPILSVVISALLFYWVLPRVSHALGSVDHVARRSALLDARGGSGLLFVDSGSRVCIARRRRGRWTFVAIC